MAQSQQATIAQVKQLTANATANAAGNAGSPAPSGVERRSLTDMSIEPLDSIEPLHSSLFTLDSSLMEELVTLREKCASQTASIDTLVRQGEASLSSLAADKLQLQSQVDSLKRDLGAALLAQETALAKAATFESRTLSLLSKVEELTIASTLASERVKALGCSSSKDSLRIQALERANARLQDDNDELKIQVSCFEHELALSAKSPLKAPRKLPSAQTTPSRVAPKPKGPTPFASTRTSTLRKPNGTGTPAARKPPGAAAKPNTSDELHAPHREPAIPATPDPSLRRATSATVASAARATAGAPRSIGRQGLAQPSRPAPAGGSCRRSGLFE